MVFLLGLVFGTSAHAFEPTSTYAKLNVNGWTVYVSSSFQKNEKGRRAILNKIERQTAAISKAVPRKQLKTLRKASIWVEDGRHYRSLARYHGGKTDIFQEDLNPAKYRDVEIFGSFARARAPSLILHELAHVYHDRGLSWSSSKIKRLYRRFKAGNPNAKDRCGPKSRAYALTNENEFFATFTEAYFGKVCVFPYDRSTIQKSFPEMYELLVRAWGK